MNIDDRRPTTYRPQGPFTHFGKTSNGHNSATRQPIPFMFGSSGVFGDGGSNGAISGWIKFKMAAGMAAGGHLGKLQTAISQRRVIRSTSCLVPRWGSRGRQIERRHFRLHQIQDGSRRPYWKILNGHISATRHPIDFMFGSMVGFSGTADRTAPFGLDQIQDGGRRPSWKTSNGHMSATYYPIYCMYVHRPYFAVGL